MDISQTSRYLSQVNIDSTKAQLLRHSELPSVEINRQKGGLVIDNPPVKLDIDNRAFFDSMGLKGIEALADDLVARGRKAVLEGEARYAQEADILATPNNNDAFSEIAFQRSQKTIETMLAFIPGCPPEMNWSGGELDIEYTPDVLTFDWDTGGTEGTYIPYKVDFTVIE